MSEVFHDAAARCKTTLTPGAIDNDTSTLDATKEHLRLDQLIPQEIISDRAKLEEFLKAYYTFMNMDDTRRLKRLTRWYWTVRYRLE